MLHKAHSNLFLTLGGNLSWLPPVWDPVKPFVQNEYCCLLFYVLGTSKFILRQVPTCDLSYGDFIIVHSWGLYSAASLGHQATSTFTCYPTQSHYPDILPTSPCAILLMPSARIGSDKYKYLSHGFDSIRVRTRELQISRSAKTGGGWMLYLFSHPAWS